MNRIEVATLLHQTYGVRFSRFGVHNLSQLSISETVNDCNLCSYVPFHFNLGIKIHARVYQPVNWTDGG